jgi:hypothetical protein
VSSEQALLEAARRDDGAAFARLVEPYRAELDALGPDGRRELVDAFVAAWERTDVAALLELLADDARFTMPPLPAWFSGRADIGRFVARRMFAPLAAGADRGQRPARLRLLPGSGGRPGRRPVPARRDQRGRPARRAGRGAGRVHRPGPSPDDTDPWRPPPASSAAPTPTGGSPS